MSASLARLFEELRPAAFAIAYRMLGSVSEAEDVVQEAFLRLHRMLREGERVESPRAYLSTVVTRLCIDQLRSARARRERYVGEWLPEPLLASDEADPARHAEVADSLSLAFLVLREVFDYPYDQIARIVGKSEDNTRQLVTRARRQVQEGRPRFEASRERREVLARRFFAAAVDGELEALEELLAHDVVLHGDGGGKAPALAHPVHGRAKVARTLLAWFRAAARIGGVSLQAAEVNGQPGALLLDPEGRLVTVLSVDVADGQVQAIRSIVNPDKLRHLGPTANLGEQPAGD
jgi:RNA polymerase sigma-70 factor (ECF subfamily)